ncbi:MAG: HAMP domain-containing histidine kinase [Cryomorphaceae bacterium]|nr:HAMP domain-containing histidine kinase [Cryomorphaceae bacterium]
MKASLRIRMFLAMLGLIFLSFLMTGTISYYFFKAENEEYNLERLKRKEYAIRATIDYFIRNLGEDLYQNPERLVEVFDDRICELADIHNQDIGFYDFEGKYIISSAASNGGLFPPFLNSVLLGLVQQDGAGVTVENHPNNRKYILSGTVVTDERNRPLAILKFPYETDERFEQEELREFFASLFGIFGLVFFIAVVIALILSNSIARPLTILREKISRTQLANNQPIEGSFPLEIQRLANEYNRMLKALHDAALELAKKERHSAWQDMAKQVAHEIKNPLTPMKLNLQMLEQKFRRDKNPSTEIISGLIAQVDAMAQIADTFSRYANLPDLKKDPLHIQPLIRNACALFHGDNLHLDDRTTRDLYIKGDKEQLIRALNNLIKNAQQAGEKGVPPNIEIIVEDAGHEVCIAICDDGVGIPKSEHEKIFEPRFTTKSAGMGLGLSIVKSVIEGLDGRLSLESTPGTGSVFYVHLPKLS